MPTNVVFAFDSEDYITPQAAAAERWWAQLMTRFDVPACICVVGELARVLRRGGRRDAIRAMRRHELSYHSDRHSSPPTHAEYLERMTWDEGVAAVLQREAGGVLDLAEVFGAWPVSYCKPGYSWGPPAVEAMHRMGIPVLSDAPFEWRPGQPMWYQNMLCLEYHTSFDAYFALPSPARLEQMKSDFRRRLQELNGGTLVMYTHPCRLVTAEFWDSVNFAGGRNTERAHWRPAPLRPAVEVAGLKRDVEAFVAWVCRRREVRLTTFRSLLAEHRQTPARWLGQVALLRALAEVGDPPRPAWAGGGWLSPAEVFGIAARALAASTCGRSLPAALPLRRPIGPTASQPEIPAARTTSLEALQTAACIADCHIDETGALPSRLDSGGVEIGPNAFLQAAREVLPYLAAGAAPREVVVRPKAERVLLAQRPDFAGLHFRGTWSIFPPEFEGPRVAEMARWQAWSGKPTARWRGDPAAPATAGPSPI